MSKRNSGCGITVTLNGEQVVLRPTLRAAMLVNGRFNGFSNALQAVQRMDFDAIVFIIQAGAGVKGHAAKALAEKIFHAGIMSLIADAARFVIGLANGGRFDLDDGARGAPPDPD